MHPFHMPDEITARVVGRCGRPHPFDAMAPSRTALVVIDMQNYFLAPGAMGETPMARAVAPTINQFAAACRARGVHVVWVKNSTTDTRESWSTLNTVLFNTANSARRYATMDEAHEGHALWPEMDVQPGDASLVKKRFSAFIQGSSGIAAHLAERGIDTVLIAGTATNVCCDSSARDAMMLNYRTVMVHDCLAASSDAEHKAALTNFYNIFGDVQSAEEALAALDRGS